MTDDISKVVREMRDWIANMNDAIPSTLKRWADRLESAIHLPNPGQIGSKSVDDTPAEVDGVEADRFDPGMCSIAGEYGDMDRNDGGDYVLYDDYATLARQLAEAKAAQIDAERGTASIAHKLNAAESQLAEATRRVAEVEGLSAKWRSAAKIDALQASPVAPHHIVNRMHSCADELDAALQPKEL